MKLCIFFITFVFYTFTVHADRTHSNQQPQAKLERPALGLQSPIDKNARPAISITIHNQPQSGSQAENAIDQAAEHKSKFTTEASMNIQQKTNHNKGITVADIVNNYITMLCWPIGLIIYWARTNSDQE